MSSEDDHYSDEDFKGSSAEDPDEDDEYAKSETDSDEASYRRGRRGRREPVRRSTRARRTRYDNDFSKCLKVVMHECFVKEEDKWRTLFRSKR